MSQDVPNTRDRILQAAYALFYRRGFSRVGVDAIAERAGITKRTIYYHFRSKDDIVAEVLEAQHHHMMGQFRLWAGGDGAMSARSVETLFDQLKSWSNDPDWIGSGFSRISMELADMPGHPARRAAGRHKAAVETWLSGQLEAGYGEEAGALARQIMVLIEGGMGLALLHGDRSYFDAAAAAAQKLLCRDG